MRLNTLLLFATWLALAIGELASHLHYDSVQNLTSLELVNETRSLTSGAEPSTPFDGPQTAGWTEKEQAADDELWKRYVCKGKALMAQMSWSDYDVGQAARPPRDTAQSPWEHSQSRL